MRDSKPLESPYELVVIARAAHRSGDKELLRKAKRLLKSEFGIRIDFTWPADKSQRETEAKQ